MVSNVGSAETFLHQNLVVLNRHYMYSLNLNCLKQDPTTIGTCGRLITLLYCISTFAINIYNIWPLPVHDTLLHHIDLYFIRCNQCPLHTHCTTTRWQMLKFGGESSSVESRLTSTSSLSNSLMRKSLNSPSSVLPSISFQENVVHLVFGDEFTAL